MATTPETPIPAPVTNFPNIKCVSYTDSDDWSSCILSGITLPGATGYSYSCWVYSSNYAYRATMVILSIYEAPPSRAASQVMLSGVTSQLLLREASADIDLDPTPLPINVWNHICVTSTSTTSSGGTATLYVNGVSVASGPGFTFAAIIEDIAVSTETAGPRSAFYGKVDEVAIWDAPLTAAQVSTLYNGGRSSNINNIASSNLKIWWRMGGGKDADPSGYPHDGGAIYNDALGYEGDNTLVLAMDEYDLPSIVDDGPPSDDEFQVTTPINSGTGLIPRVLNQKSVTLDGINQSYASPIGAGPDFTIGGGMTLNCNVKLNSTPSGTRAIFGQANVDSGGTYTAFFIYMSGITLAAYAADSASGDAVGMGIANLSNDIWYTVTVTLYPGGNMVGYIWGNQYGTPVAISAGFGATWSANRCWSIGAWRWGVGANPPLADFADIQIDECAVFNLATNQNDIRAYNAKLYYRPDWSTPPVDYTIEFEGKLGYPLAWWRMGDTTDDSATQMLDAAFSDTKSQSFNGSTDWMTSDSTGGLPNTGSAAWSYSAWIKIPSTWPSPGGNYIFHSHSSDTVYGWTTKDRTSIRILSDTMKMSVTEANGHDDALIHSSFFPSYTIPNDTWCHIVITSEGTDSATSLKGYMNGIVKNSGAQGMARSASCDPQTLAMGCLFYNGPLGSTFDGTLDEVCVWHGTVLSLAGAQALYNTGTPINMDLYTGTAPTNWWRVGDSPDVSGGIGVGTVYDRMAASNDLSVGGGDATFTTDVPASGNVLTGSGLSASDIQDEIPIVYFGDVSQNAVGGPYFAPPTIITPIQVPYVNPVPIPTGVSPSSGPVTGDTTITIAGTNFVGVTTVTVGGIPCTSVTTVSAISITAVTPVGTAGAKDIVITASGGFGTLSSAFTYIFNSYSQSFNGSTDWMTSDSTGGLPNTGSAAWSYSAWIKIPTGGGGWIFHSHSSDTVYGWTNYDRVGIRPRYGGQLELMEGNGHDDAIIHNNFFPWATISMDTWHHLVITSEGTASATSLKGYLDGVEKNSGAQGVARSASCDPQTLAVGCMFYNGPFSGILLDGTLDEVCVWHGTVLDVDDALELYNSGNGAIDMSVFTGTAPTNWWRMGDLTDVSGGIGVGIVYDRMAASNDLSVAGGDATFTTDVS